MDARIFSTFSSSHLNLHLNDDEISRSHRAEHVVAY